MRILVVGAGAIGGYFGARLLATGRDVTFLVRPGRAAQLAKTGLVVRSKLGDLDLPPPPLVTADKIAGPYDLVLLSCKAFDLDNAMESFAPAMGSSILPLLNGMSHLDSLVSRFGEGAVLGGQCAISLVLDAEGRVLHLNDGGTISFGERSGPRTARIDAIAEAFAAAQVQGGASDTILQEMWEKWAFIATAAGITCLMRAAVGDIVAAGAVDRTLALFDEISSIAASQGFAPRPAAVQRGKTTLTTTGSPFTASMLRDVESGRPIEADHMLGDLLRRSGKSDSFPVLRLAYAHLKAYEARRARTQGKP